MSIMKITLLCSDGYIKIFLTDRRKDPKNARLLEKILLLSNFIDSFRAENKMYSNIFIEDSLDNLVQWYVLLGGIITE